MRANLYSFRGCTGYLIHPQKTGAAAPIALGHTASVSSWQDGDVHFHALAEELFILLQGELRFLVDETVLGLRSGEMLVVRPSVSHAILDGAGIIEHFGLRAPAVDDRHSIGQMPSSLPGLSQEEPRELREEWGCRIPLSSDGNQNCWLLGGGGARFACDHLALAYDHLQTAEAAAAFRDRDQLHAHTDSWKYSVVVKGQMTVQVDVRLVTVEAGNLLEVPPGVCHTVRDRQTPFAGFTVRAPLILDDSVVCEAA